MSDSKAKTSTVKSGVATKDAALAGSRRVSKCGMSFMTESKRSYSAEMDRDPAPPRPKR